MSAPTPAAEGITNPSIDDLLTKTDRATRATGRRAGRGYPSAACTFFGRPARISA